MKSWITEKEYRQGGGESAGVAINVPFLQEIKQDFEFRQLLEQVFSLIKQQPPLAPRIVAESLATVRDQLETYFALEEFYGYFPMASVTNATRSNQVASLKAEHATLYLQFEQIVDTCQQIVYRECKPEITLAKVLSLLDQFRLDFINHEEQEMTLMMQICNQDVGVGD